MQADDRRWALPEAERAFAELARRAQGHWMGRGELDEVAERLRGRLEAGIVAVASHLLPPGCRGADLRECGTVTAEVSADSPPVTSPNAASSDQRCEP